MIDDERLPESLKNFRQKYQVVYDIETLETRIFKKNDPTLPENSVYVFSRNVAVNEMNAEKLSQLEGRLFTVEASVQHKALRNFKPFVVPATGCIRNTNLLKTFQFKINSKIFLSYNVNTNDSLVNGAFGKVVGVKEDSSGNLLEIHVNFYNEASGKETAKGFPDLRKKYGVPTVPVKRLEAQPRIGSQNAGVKSTCTVYQFPLRLAHAVTIHKLSTLILCAYVMFACMYIFGYRFRDKLLKFLQQL